MKEYRLSKHAQIVLEERGIPLVWMDQVIQNPKLVEPDATDPDARHYPGIIQEYGNRVLRVIMNDKEAPARVVSVFFDRNMKGKL